MSGVLNVETGAPGAGVPWGGLPGQGPGEAACAAVPKAEPRVMARVSETVLSFNIWFLLEAF